MQVALLSDVHANLEALDAVLRDVDRYANGARIVCAGDIVGYGPDPEACLDRLLARDALIVRGNHEEMVLGWRDNSRCIHAGIIAVAWTREQLSLRALTILAGLPAVADIEDGIVVCHGDLDDAGTYVSDGPRALRALDRLRVRDPEARLLVCGHTHQAMFFSHVRGALPVGAPISFRTDNLCLINPGAVGQAREKEPLASWALLDLDRDVVSYASLPYDHSTTIAKLRSAGLVARVTLAPRRGMARQFEPTRAKAARLWVGARPHIADAVGKALLPHTAGAGAPEFEAPRLRRRVLTLAQRAIHRAGVSRAFLRMRSAGGSQGSALILGYHSITSNDQVPFVDPRFSVPLPIFEEQMAFLAAERRVLSMTELIDRVQRETQIPPGSVVITFDDGYLDTLKVAAPVLEGLKLPALVYLPTGQISRAQTQFIDVLYGAFTLRTRNLLELPLAGLTRVALQGREVVQGAYSAIAERLITMPLSERDELLSLIVDELQPSRPLRRMTMNWDDVLELCARHPSFDVGVHTRDHVDLTACDARTAHEELVCCVCDLRTATGRNPEHFAYPYGRSSTQVRDDISSTTLRSAVSTEPGVVGHGGDLFRLPRLLAPPSMELFPFYTSGAYPDVSKALLRRI